MSSHDSTEILFADEKKAMVTNMLDTAVKLHGLESSDYLALKEEIFEEIEAPGNEARGLYEFVEITSDLVAHRMGLESLNIVVSKGPPPKPPRKKKAQPTEQSEPAPVRSEDDGKGRLLQLLRLLPPYLPSDKVDHYHALIRKLPLGQPSGSAKLETVDDVELEIMDGVRANFLKKFAELTAQAPDAFYDQLDDGHKRKRRVNVAPALRKQIGDALTIRQFLAVKDLIVRHVAAYREDKKKAAKKGSLKFWKR